MSTKNPFSRQNFRGRKSGGKTRFKPPASGSRSRIPIGPRIFLKSLLSPEQRGGCGDPPPGFIGGSNSLSEWLFYCALEKELGPEGVDWTYQSSYLGGRYMRGGAVIDFVIFTPRYNIGIRIQSFYFHVSAEQEKQSSDLEQRIRLEQYGLRVIDVYEQDFIGDRTGNAARRLVRMALAGEEMPNPRAYGIVREI